MTASQAADTVVIGGGIVGLASALAIAERRPGARIVVVDKEHVLAAHQTGHNSGVLHSGIYYRPGSLKAALCRAGNARMREFCDEEGIAYEVTGKLIVATERDELRRLDDLHARALAHGLDVERLGPDGLREHEPHVAGIAGLYLGATGIVDFKGVAAAMARRIEERGGEIRLGTEVSAIRRAGSGWTLETTNEPLTASVLVNCAGLQSDRVARKAGTDPGARIVPFRGEYYELVPEAQALVNGLIYPVPDPSFPFLGVHFTRMIDGSVHCGPNAVLAAKREGYRWRDVSVRDLADTFGYRGFWRLAGRHGRSGAGEVARSLSKRLFVRSLQRLVPELTRHDVARSAAGVRAQALAPDGSLIDDFLIVGDANTVHVCNAPSPAATSSLEIGRVIAERVAPMAQPGSTGGEADR